MRKSGSQVLGLMFSERSIVLAQVSTGRIVGRVGQFTFDRPLLEKPAETGAALKAFLESHDFGAEKAVVGVPARWVIAQERDLPPAGLEESMSILRLHGERLSLAESGTLVVDFAGKVGTGASRVMLVGMLRATVEKIRTLVESADLALDSICPTSLALSSIVGSDHSLLQIRDDGAELVQWQDATPRLLRPLTGTNDVNVLGAELKRALAMRASGSGELVVCDGVGIGSAGTAELGNRLNSRARSVAAGTQTPFTVDPAALNGAAGTLRGDGHVPAVALAIASMAPPRLPIDFIASKLAVKEPARFGRPAIIGAAVAAALLLGIIVLYLLVQTKESHLDSMRSQISKATPDVRKAQTQLAHWRFARTFLDPTVRPNYLNCLRDLSALRDYEQPIYITSINIRDFARCQIQGKSSDEKLPLQLVPRMIAANGKFGNVTMIDYRKGSGRSEETTFSIGFSYIGQEKKK